MPGHERIAQRSDINEVITDDEIPKEHLVALRAHNTQVTVVPTDEVLLDGVPQS